MKTVWAVLLLFSAPAWGQDTITVIRGGTVIDSTGQAPIEDAVIVIEGERIREIGTADRVSVPEGAEVIDAAGKWIVPGLIDAHVHFFQSGGMPPRSWGTKTMSEPWKPGSTPTWRYGIEIPTRWRQQT